MRRPGRPRRHAPARGRRPRRCRAAAPADAFTPARVIESTQEDGTIVYELFAPGKADEPAAEVNWQDGKAVLRTTRNEY